MSNETHPQQAPDAATSRNEQTSPSPAATAAAAARAEMSEQPGAAAGMAGERSFNEAAVQALELHNAELERQIKDLTDRLLRTHAEMDNLRKRTEREKADTAKYAVTKMAQDIVGVADNLRRAIAATMATDGSPSDVEGPQLAALREGVVLTDQELTKVLERNGITRITPRGEIFNPHFHQAVMEREDKSVAAGTVLQVFQDGYIIGDRVLRPAMVQVARGGFKPVREPSAPPASNAAPGTGEAASDGAHANGPSANGGAAPGDPPEPAGS